MSEINDEEEFEELEEKNFIIPQADSSILMAPPYKIEGRPPRVMKERVQLRDIKGSLKDNELFDKFFRPKLVNKKIRKIWKWVAGQQKSRKSFNGISLTKISNHEYYVFEGIRRVSALKNLGWRQIDAIVADFTHLKTGRPPVYRKYRRYRRYNDNNKGGNNRDRPVQIFAPRNMRPSGIKKDYRRKRND